jgi:predicted MFS family arabinose efflux permease
MDAHTGLNISTWQYTRLVAIYGIAAAVTGFLAGFVLDRVTRKHALLALYAGFCVATFACALASTYWALMGARCAAGAFGGVAGSVVAAMVGDIIPPERRGRAMAVIAASYPLAMVLGIPFGLQLANMFKWHTPFFVLAGLGVIVFCIGAKTLPPIQPFANHVNPWAQVKEICSHRVHVRGFVLSVALLFAGASVVPLMAPSMHFNAGISENYLSLIYLCGGVLTFITTPIVGCLTDFHDKVGLIGIFCFVAGAAALLLTNLGHVPLWVALVVSSLFLSSMSARFGPTMALLLNSVEARYRGGFMSVNASIQQASAGLATMAAGFFVTDDPVTHRLIGFQWVGVMSAVFMGCTYVLARRLKALAPWASEPGVKSPRVAGPGTLLNRIATGSSGTYEVKDSDGGSAGSMHP